MPCLYISGTVLVVQILGYTWSVSWLPNWLQGYCPFVSIPRYTTPLIQQHNVRWLRSSFFHLLIMGVSMPSTLMSNSIIVLQYRKDFLALSVDDCFMLRWAGSNYDLERVHNPDGAVHKSRFLTVYIERRGIWWHQLTGHWILDGKGCRTPTGSLRSTATDFALQDAFRGKYVAYLHNLIHVFHDGFAQNRDQLNLP